MQPVSSNIIRSGRVFATVQYLGAVDEFQPKIVLLVDFGQNYGAPCCYDALERAFNAGYPYDSGNTLVMLRGEMPDEATRVLVTMKLDKPIREPAKFIAAKARKLKRWILYYESEFPTPEEIDYYERYWQDSEEDLYALSHPW